MNLKQLIKAPEKLTATTQTAVVISSLALIVAVIALFAASHRRES